MKTAARNNIQNGTPNSLVNRGNESFFGVQAKLTVGKANDKYEVEADRVADKVVAKGNQTDSFFSDTSFFPSKKQAAIQKVPFEEVQAKEEIGEDEIQKMPFEEVRKKPDPISTIQESPVKEEELQEKEEEEEGEETTPIATKELTLQRKETGTPSVSQHIESRIHRASNSGRTLENGVKNSMERSFDTDFSNVQIHTDEESAKLNSQLSARAFTYKNNIFFGRGQYQPESTSGKHLLAHELTHVVQQGHAIQKKDEISPQTSEGTVQRLGISDALDHFANAANALPGFRMFTIFLGINPINMSSVERSAANIMRAIVEFLPGGFLITQVLDKYNVFTEAADLMKETLDSLSITGDSIKEGIDNFLDSLSWSDIFDLGGVWERAKNMILAPINQLIELGKTTLSAIYEIVKKAILSPLAELAQGTDGYDLLKAVLGEDPITGDPYPPTAENLIGGFMKLIGQEEIWQNIQKGGAIGQAYTWFQGALSGLKAIVMGIPGIVISTITSLTWDDLIILPNAFIKVGKAFLNIAGQFTSWALGTTIDLLKILFSVVAPGVMPYIAKAGAAFNTILENPIGFVGNLVTAAKTGFQQFAANIGKHLKASLLNWLLVSLEGAGIYLPQELSFKEILKFVASVLGLTWENLRIKLVKHLGEPAVKALEAGFELIQILITEGPAAAWEKIMEHLSNLQSMIISEISQFVIVQVVQTAIAKLVTSLNPAGAVIQAIIAIYQTITFLIDKIQQIARVGAAIIDSIAAIANGVITAAANKVEQTLAGMLTLAVNFLAKFAGLGKISDAIINIVNKIRAPIDTAMDKIVEWIVAKGKSFLKKIVGAGTPENPQEKLEEGLSKAVSAVNKLKGNNIGKKLINPILAGIKVRYDFQVLTAEPKGKFWVIKGKVNPEGEKPTTIEVGVDEDKKVSFSVGEVISARYKNGMYVAIIVEVNDSTKMVGYDFVAQNGKFFKRFDVFEDAVKSGEVQKYVADKRGTFMGSNPSRNSSVGTAIKNRMKGEGTYKIEGNPPVELIEYPKGSGNWHPLDTCDLSHEPVDAVTWWNTIGYKFGPRSPKVKEFMTNPNNYIFEPLSSNRGRGSRSNEEYRLPEKV